MPPFDPEYLRRLTGYAAPASYPGPLRSPEDEAAETARRMAQLFREMPQEMRLTRPDRDLVMPEQEVTGFDPNSPENLEIRRLGLQRAATEIPRRGLDVLAAGAQTATQTVPEGLKSMGTGVEQMAATLMSPDMLQQMGWADQAEDGTLVPTENAPDFIRRSLLQRMNPERLPLRALLNLWGGGLKTGVGAAMGLTPGGATLASGFQAANEALTYEPIDELIRTVTGDQITGEGVSSFLAEPSRTVGGGEFLAKYMADDPRAQAEIAGNINNIIDFSLQGKLQKIVGNKLAGRKWSEGVAPTVPKITLDVIAEELGIKQGESAADVQAREKANKLVQLKSDLMDQAWRREVNMNDVPRLFEEGAAKIMREGTRAKRQTLNMSIGLGPDGLTKSARAIKKFIEDRPGGFTMDTATDADYPLGEAEYATGLGSDLQLRFGSDASDADKEAMIGEWLRRNEDAFRANPNVKVGGWRDPQTGETVVDVAFVGPKRDVQAVATGTNQKAIYGEGQDFPVFTTPEPGFDFSKRGADIVPEGLPTDVTERIGAAKTRGEAELERRRDVGRLNDPSIYDRTDLPDQGVPAPESVPELYAAAQRYTDQYLGQDPIRMEGKVTPEQRAAYEARLMRDFEAGIKGRLDARKKGPAPDWYKESMEGLHGGMRKLYGEQYTPGHEALADVVMSIASSGANPATETVVGLQAFNNFMRTGKLEPGDLVKVQRPQALFNKLAMVGEMVRTMGLDGFAKFLETPTTYGELVARYPSFQHSALKGVKGEYLGADMFGPKIGEYYLTRRGWERDPVKDTWHKRQRDAAEGIADVRPDPDDPMKSVLVSRAWSGKYAKAFDNVSHRLAEKYSMDVSQVQAELWTAEREWVQQNLGAFQGWLDHGKTMNALIESGWAERLLRGDKTLQSPLSDLNAKDRELHPMGSPEEFLSARNRKDYEHLRPDTKRLLDEQGDTLFSKLTWAADIAIKIGERVFRGRDYGQGTHYELATAVGFRHFDELGLGRDAQMKYLRDRILEETPNTPAYWRAMDDFSVRMEEVAGQWDGYLGKDGKFYDREQAQRKNAEVGKQDKAFSKTGPESFEMRAAGMLDAKTNPFALRGKAENVVDESVINKPLKPGQPGYLNAKALPDFAAKVIQRSIEEVGRRAYRNPAMRDWFGNSRMTNTGEPIPKGYPIPMFHVTNKKGPLAEFEAPEARGRDAELGIHFGTPGQAAERMFARGYDAQKPEDLLNPESYKDAHQTVPAFLKLENPFEFSGDLGAWGPQDIYSYLRRQIGGAEGLFYPDLERLVQGLVWANRQDNPTEATKRVFQHHGFDGFTYPNGGEIPGVQELTVKERGLRLRLERERDSRTIQSLQKQIARIQMEKQELFHGNVDRSYAVFEPQQVRSVFAKFDPARAGEADILATQALPPPLAKVVERVMKNPYFVKWFGGSKVTDEKGNPLPVFHGTRGDFDVFQRGDLGFHFGTTEQANYRTEAKRNDGKTRGSVMPVFLSIKNPLRMDDVGEWDSVGEVANGLRDAGVVLPSRRSVRDWTDMVDSGISEQRAMGMLRSELEQLGYDGIVYENLEEGAGDSYIAFRPEQIKSATGNRGTYDPTDSNILRADVTGGDIARKVFKRAVTARRKEPKRSALASDIPTSEEGKTRLKRVAQGKEEVGGIRPDSILYLERGGGIPVTYFRKDRTSKQKKGVLLAGKAGETHRQTLQRHLGVGPDESMQITRSGYVIEGRTAQDGKILAVWGHPKDFDPDQLVDFAFGLVERGELKPDAKIYFSESQGGPIKIADVGQDTPSGRLNSFLLGGLEGELQKRLEQGLEKWSKARYAGNLNQETMGGTDQQKAVREAAYETFGPMLEEAYGRPVTHEEVLAFADQLSNQVTDTIPREQQVQIMAQLTSMRQKIEKMDRDIAKTGKVSEDYLKAVEAYNTWAQFAGRLLNVLKIQIAESETAAADPNRSAVDIFRRQVLRDVQRELEGDVEAIKKMKEKAKALDWNNQGQVNQFYRDYVKPTNRELLDEFRYINMLSSPRTHSVNFFSNAGQMGLQIATRAVRSVVDKDVYAAEVPAMVKGQLQAVPRAFEEAWGTLSGKRPMTRPDVQHIPTMGAAKYAWMKPVAKFNKAASPVLRALEAGDRFFRTIAEGGELEALNVREKKGGQAIPDKEAKAMQEGAYYVYRGLREGNQGMLMNGINRMTDSIQRMRNGPSQIPKWFLPFVETPVNILKQGIEYSPAGFFNMLGKNDARAESFSKALIGSMVMGATAKFLEDHEFTFAPPTSERERDDWAALGIQPYSVKIGGTWYSYSKLGTLSYPIAFVAAMKEAMLEDEGDKTRAQRVNDAIGSYVRFFADQSYVKGLGDLADLARGRKSLPEVTGVGLGRQVIPLGSAVGWGNDLYDRVKREPGTPAEKMMARIPILSERVPAKISPTGEIEEKEDLLVNLMNVSPVYATKARLNPVLNWTRRHGVTVGTPSRKIEGFEIPPAQYQDYAIRVGVIVADQLNMLRAANPDLPGMTQAQKQARVDKIVREARERVAEEMIQLSQKTAERAAKLAQPKR